MMLTGARTNLLRTARGQEQNHGNHHEHHRVTYVELFFDLVFVFAITQLSHGLLEHLTPLGVLQTGLLMLAVWWAWIDTAWITNWLDPEKPAARLMLFGLMFAGLVMSCSIPKAFEDRALPFALAYVCLQMGRCVFMLWALQRHDPANHLNFLRINIWQVSSAPFWIAGAFATGPWRIALWAAAAAMDTAAPATGFWVPGLGRSTTADWRVEGGHIAERCALFVIIARGESILITGATFASLEWNLGTVTAFVVAFVGSIALWAVYFNIGAERSSRTIASSDDPGRIARSGYTYIHILIVAGIIVSAVGDELVLHHPGGHTDIKTAMVIIGGPALYLIGNMLFKRLSAPHLPLSHLIGLGLLTLSILLATVASPLLLSAATTSVLIVVAVWEWMSFRQRPASAAH
jgi:low temperature requirement protein LtrA